MLKNLRLNLVFCGFFLLAVLFSLRLFNIQILHHSEYIAMAQSQHFANTPLVARRGNIYTSDNYPLALTETRYFLYAEPNKINDSTSYAKTISMLLEQNEKKAVDLELELKKKLSQKDLYWVGLERNLSLKQKQSIEDLNFEGLGFEDEYVRYYPEGSLASHLLGFVRSDEDGNPKGYFGLEGFYNGDIKGVSGFIYQEQDAYGFPIAVGNYKKVLPKNGRNLVLTIDRAIQFLVEKELKDAVENYSAKSGTVIIVEPNLGQILALANYPNFDPLNPLEDEVLEGTRNLAIASTYEPGSVVKGLTMSAAVDLGKMTPESTYMDDGPKVFSGHLVDTWDGKHFGLETMISILQHSNNLGAAYVGQKVGADNLREYFIKFGLGEKTGVDLEGEDTGVIRQISYWTDIDLATASFGQGISATPLQVAMAFSAISNNGNLMRPYVVSKIVDDFGNVISEFEPRVVRRVISKESSETLVDMLTKAVLGGEAKYFISQKYQVAGKTGTAQIPVGGKYDPNKTNATFVGFLPKSKKFVMLVKLEEPTTSIFASETTVPVWMGIAESLAAYYGIPPDR